MSILKSTNLLKFPQFLDKIITLRNHLLLINNDTHDVASIQDQSGIHIYACVLPNCPIESYSERMNRSLYSGSDSMHLLAQNGSTYYYLPQGPIHCYIFFDEQTCIIESSCDEQTLKGMKLCIGQKFDVGNISRFRSGLYQRLFCYAHQNSKFRANDLQRVGPQNESQYLEKVENSEMGRQLAEWDRRNLASDKPNRQSLIDYNILARFELNNSTFQLICCPNDICGSEIRPPDEYCLKKQINWELLQNLLKEHSESAQPDCSNNL
eukprot:c18402_g1_i1.p1 GENE.c18402_g1_i1~~c18402_g1_i1.p1  ORF type:complete len:266 (+),score=24.39 c18402_g1_i1:579-1376(+)